MGTTDQRAPQARNEGLVVHELADEVLVYDLERHRAHALNRTAAWVWRHCDGSTSVDKMAALLQSELNIPADEEAVWLAVERLGRAHLLRERLAPRVATARSSRRELVRRLAMAGGLAMVTSVVAPKASAAGSAISVATCQARKNNVGAGCQGTSCVGGGHCNHTNAQNCDCT